MGDLQMTEGDHGIDPQTITLLQEAFEQHPEFARILLAVVNGNATGDEYRQYDVSIGNTVRTVDR
jgi:hypothetical protein